IGRLGGVGRVIVTLTMNPALDRTVSLPAALAVGEVQAVTAIREDAAGKGINVARVLAAAGIEVTAVLPLASEDPYAATLRSQFGGTNDKNPEIGRASCREGVATGAVGRCFGEGENCAAW